MFKKPVISVIIPVYGVEKYIAKCLKSIQEQTFTGFECIVVDDGSPDDSIIIGKRAVEGDGRFIFVTKENGGLASARNFGLKHAKGDYIAFVDSDDYVEPTFLEEPYNALVDTGADVCMLGIKYVSENGTVLKEEINDVESYYLKNDFLISQNTVTQYAWSKLYKKNIFQEILFNEEIITYEDVYVMFKILYGKNIVNVRTPLYNYLQRGGTLSRDIKPTYLQDRLKIVEAQKQFVADRQLEEGNQEYIQFTYLKTFLGYCIVKFSLYSKNYSVDIALLKKNLQANALSMKNIILMIKQERRIGLALLVFKVSPILFKTLIRQLYKDRVF